MFPWPMSNFYCHTLQWTWRQTLQFYFSEINSSAIFPSTHQYWHLTIYWPQSVFNSLFPRSFVSWTQYRDVPSLMFNVTVSACLFYPHSCWYSIKVNRRSSPSGWTCRQTHRPAWLLYSAGSSWNSFRFSWIATSRVTSLSSAYVWVTCWKIAVSYAIATQASCRITPITLTIRSSSRVITSCSCSRLSCLWSHETSAILYTSSSGCLWSSSTLSRPRRDSWSSPFLSSRTDPSTTSVCCDSAGFECSPRSSVVYSAGCPDG